MTQITILPTLTDIDVHETTDLTWEEIVERLSTHTPTADKLKAPLFGPYALTPPKPQCQTHPTRTGPHRCDACVQEITLAVFDADAGTELDMETCDARLASQGIARLWYSSHSYSPPTADDLSSPVSLRLVLPLARPIPAAEWQSTRARLIDLFAIPADVKKCSGRSHSYFLPTCPPGAMTFVRVGKGKPLDVQPGYVKSARQFEAVTSSFAWPEEPETPPDLEPYHVAILERAKRLDGEKAKYLLAVVKGERLCDTGRNQALTVVSGMLAWMFPHAPKSVFVALLQPVYEATRDEDCKTGWAGVMRMVERSMRKKHAALALEDAIDRALFNTRQKAKGHK